MPNLAHWLMHHQLIILPTFSFIVIQIETKCHISIRWEFFKCYQQNLLISVADLVVALVVVLILVVLWVVFVVVLGFDNSEFSDISVEHWSSQYPHCPRTGILVDESIWVGHHSGVLLGGVEMQFVISFPLNMKGKTHDIPSTVLHCVFFDIQSS